GFDHACYAELDRVARFGRVRRLNRAAQGAGRASGFAPGLGRRVAERVDEEDARGAGVVRAVREFAGRAIFMRRGDGDAFLVRRHFDRDFGRKFDRFGPRRRGVARAEESPPFARSRTVVAGEDLEPDVFAAGAAPGDRPGDLDLVRGRRYSRGDRRHRRRSRTADFD